MANFCYLNNLIKGYFFTFLTGFGTIVHSFHEFLNKNSQTLWNNRSIVPWIFEQKFLYQTLWNNRSIVPWILEQILKSDFFSETILVSGASHNSMISSKEIAKIMQISCFKIRVFSIKISLQNAAACLNWRFTKHSLDYNNRNVSMLYVQCTIFAPIGKGVKTGCPIILARSLAVTCIAQSGKGIW